MFVIGEFVSYSCIHPSLPTPFSSHGASPYLREEEEEKRRKVVGMGMDQKSHSEGKKKRKGDENGFAAAPLPLFPQTQGEKLG